MPLILPVGDSDTYSIFGTAPFLGALLGPDQSIAVVSSDPNSVILTPDSTPLPTPPDPNPATATYTPIPTGTPTIASGSITQPASPAQLNVPISCTATVSNSDGSVAESLTDTVTISETAATAIGDLFGAAMPVTSASAQAKH